MLQTVRSATVLGVDAIPVDVEVNLASGLPQFSVVGLPVGAVREGRDRVTAALQNSGWPVPHRRITVNLAPADVRKDGSALDLPIAVGLLAATGAIPPDRIEGFAFVGELGLDGTVRRVRGAIAVAAACRAAGLRGLVLPRENAAEAAALSGLDVLGAGTLDDVRRHFAGEASIRATTLDAGGLLASARPSAPDLRDVRGQASVKRALEVAAAGAHNLLLVGPPGAGKTMLARRLPGILPSLSVDEALEVTRVHSAAGRLAPGTALVTTRPFRAPHHTVSEAGLVGGGSTLRPGEASLAHHGVLFLDELPEFRRNALEALRQPLEDGWVSLARARGRALYPARFTLVAAMNPCPCGLHGDGSDRCTCDPVLVQRYASRVSGPLLDRLDLHVSVPRVDVAALEAPSESEATSTVRARVVEARAVQHRRFRSTGRVHANGQMGPAEIRRFCPVGGAVGRILGDALERWGLSARAYHRILKVARTLADLDGSSAIGPVHAAEAVQYRTLDRAPGSVSGSPPAS